MFRDPRQRGASRPEMRRFGGILSEEYDLISLWLPHYQYLQESVALAIAAHHRGPRVIDLGVGTGATTAAILALNPGARVIGVDHEPEMLAKAGVRLRAEADQGWLRLEEADALEFLACHPDESTDVVASALTLHNCLDSYRTLLEIEILRILTRGGTFVNTDKYANDNHEQYVQEVTDAILSFDVLIPTGQRELRRALIDHEIRDQDPKRIMLAEPSLRRLRDIGFATVEITRRVGQYATAVAAKSRA